MILIPIYRGKMVEKCELIQSLKRKVARALMSTAIDILLATFCLQPCSSSPKNKWWKK
jgi:hypothetical protein